MSGAKLRTDDPVADTARRFLDELMPILQARCPGEDDKPLELSGLFSSWVPDEHPELGSRLYRAVPQVLSLEQMCASRILSEMWSAGSPMVDDLTEAMNRDPTIGPRLDHVVISSGAGGTTWQAQTAFQSLIDRAIEQAGGFDLAPTERDSWVAGWVKSLRRRSDLLTVIVVLAEFDAEQIPIVLEEGLEIDELADVEMSSALALSGRTVSGDSRIISRTFGIRTSFESPLFVDEIPAAEGIKDQAARRDAYARTELVLLALRVFKASRVGKAGAFDYSRPAVGVAPISGSLSPRFGWPPAEPYALTAEEASTFREFWPAFRSAYRDRVVEGALRRFGYAAERTRSDDEIVDLLIAAESLFLSGMDPRDRGELRFRLSTRVASLLGESLDERLQIAKFMRHAYDARSGIVHGGVLRAKDLRTLDGDRVSVEEFADALEAVLRRALREAITLKGSISLSRRTGTSCCFPALRSRDPVQRHRTKLVRDLSRLGRVEAGSFWAGADANGVPFLARALPS